MDADADLFKAIGDATRRTILDELTDRDGQTLFEICGRLTMKHGLASSRQAISQHLAVLEEAGLVTRSREQQRRPVHLEAEVFDLMTKWIERYRQQAEERYRRLDDVLARMDADGNLTPETPAAPETMEGTAS